MSVFNGKWKRTSATNLDAFLAASGAGAEAQAKIRALFEASDVVDEVKMEGNSYTRKTYFSGALKAEMAGEIGKPMAREGVLGKTTIVLEKPSENVIVAKETGDNVRGVITFTVTGDTMTLSWELNGVTAVRTFARE